MTIRELIRAYIELSEVEAQSFRALMEHVDNEGNGKPKYRLKKHKITCVRCGTVTLRARNAQFCSTNCSTAASRERNNQKVHSTAPESTKAWKATLLKGDSLTAGK